MANATNMMTGVIASKTNPDRAISDSLLTNSRRVFVEIPMHSTRKVEFVGVTLINRILISQYLLHPEMQTPVDQDFKTLCGAGRKRNVQQSIFPWTKPPEDRTESPDCSVDP